MLKMYAKYAYLIVICERNGDKIEICGAEIWSSPEWEQSRCLDKTTFVAYKVAGRTFQEAIDIMLRTIKEPKSRYHWLFEYLPDRHKENKKTITPKSPWGGLASF